jgi:flagellar secretion chaperone FliS
MPTDPKTTYLEATVRTAGPVELVLMMYDMMMADMRRAIEAIREGSVERRTLEMKHALLVVEQLQGGLNFQDGGEAAKLLNGFYSHLRAKLLEAQIRVSVALLEEQIQHVCAVRQQWLSFIPDSRNDQAAEYNNSSSDPAECTAQWSA